MREFDDLVAVMARLRKECPWDQKQTLESLRKYLLEEAYECVTAIQEIEKKGFDPLIEELGDVQMQILFQSEILQEKLKRPVLREVLSTLKEKLVRRHPHIFAGVSVADADAVLKQWEEIKKAEKKEKQESLLDGIAKGLTGLQTAQKIGDRSKEVKFDWQNSEEVWKHFESEIAELKNANTREEKEAELGDMLFCLAQWARHEKIDSEVALASTNDRFRSRFQKMEELARQKKADFSELPLPEKEELWTAAKKSERS